MHCAFLLERLLDSDDAVLGVLFWSFGSIDLPIEASASAVSFHFFPLCALIFVSVILWWSLFCSDLNVSLALSTRSLFFLFFSFFVIFVIFGCDP